MVIQPTYTNLATNIKANSQQYLDKLYMYDITTLPQIQNKATLAIITSKEFHTKYKHTPKTIPRCPLIVPLIIALGGGG